MSECFVSPPEHVLQKPEGQYYTSKLNWGSFDTSHAVCNRLYHIHEK
jgi:hypothetical protein